MGKANRIGIALINAVFLTGALYLILDNAIFQLGGTSRVIENHTTSFSLHAGKVASIQYTFYYSASDAGNTVLFHNESSLGQSFNFDSGLGLYFGTVEGDDIQAISGHACSSVLAEKEALGVLTTKCNMATKKCTEFCLMTVNQVPVYHDTYIVEEYFRLKNSVGFGAVFTRQTITDLSKQEEGTFLATSKITSVSNKNSEEFWQVILFVLSLSSILWSIVVRYMACIGLSQGVIFNNTTLTIMSDLFGSLLTSPGVYWASTMLIMSSCQNWTVMEATGGLTRQYSIDFFVTYITASLVTFMYSSILSNTSIKLCNSGSTVFLWTLIARFITYTKSREAAFSQVRTLGMVLIRECPTTKYDITGMEVEGLLYEETNVACSIADGVGMSGLEIFVQIYSNTFLYAALFVLGSELVLQVRESRAYAIKVIAQQSSRHSRRVEPDGTRTVTKVKNEGVPTRYYEMVLLLNGASRSAFCKMWARPIKTKIGKFYTLGSMIEDNLIMWGPLLIHLHFLPLVLIMAAVKGKKMTVKWLLTAKLYVAVQSGPSKLVSVFMNQDQIPEYVEKNDFKSAGIANPEPMAA